MYLTFNLDEVDTDLVVFGDKKKNNIMEYGDYINIIYSTDYFVLNNIVVDVSFVNISFEPYFNKFKSSFQYERNRYVVDSLIELEKNILTKYCNNKIHVSSLKDQLCKNSFKTFPYKMKQIKTNKIYRKINISIKFSGVWEKDNEIGVIYKFILHDTDV